MGKPKIPYRAKRLIEAALESEWDFEVMHTLAGLYLTLTDGTTRLDGSWRKQAANDTTGRETLAYRQSYLTVQGGDRTHPAGITVDDAENIMRTARDRYYRPALFPKTMEKKPAPVASRGWGK